MLTEFGRASCASLFFQYEDIGEGVEISREYDKFEDKTRYTLTLNHLGPEYLRPNEDIMMIATGTCNRDGKLQNCNKPATVSFTIFFQSSIPISDQVPVFLIIDGIRQGSKINGIGRAYTRLQRIRESGL